MLDVYITIQKGTCRFSLLVPSGSSSLNILLYNIKLQHVYRFQRELLLIIEFYNFSILFADLH